MLLENWVLPIPPKYTLTLDELRDLAMAGHCPIVFVSLLPIDGHDDFHSLVVFGFTQHDVLVLDPLAGERAIPFKRLAQRGV